MTKEKQLVAIAQACKPNIHRDISLPGEPEAWVWADGSITGDPYTDPLASLKIEERIMESTKGYSSLIQDHEPLRYIQILGELVGAKRCRHEVEHTSGGRTMTLVAHPYALGELIKIRRATPPQILEAVLKTLGLWEDGP